MKKSYLLPAGFKKIGLRMVLPFFVLSVLCLCGVMDDMNLSFLSVKMPALIDYSGWFTMNETNLIDEIAMLGLLVSLVFIGLSRERDEDEMTAHIRMQSFVWSAWPHRQLSLWEYSSCMTSSLLLSCSWRCICT